MLQRKSISLGILFLAASVLTLAAEDVAVDTINSFEKLFGVTEGKRRNHTKGFCFSATLMPKDKAILEYSDSPLFTAKATVIGRFIPQGRQSRRSGS